MSKRPIEIYTHKDKKRLNNPPVGLVSPETDRETGKKAYTWAMLHPRPTKKKLTDSIVPVMDGIRRKRSQ